MNANSTPAFLSTQFQQGTPQFTDSVKTLIWMTDPDGVLTYLSRDVSHLFSEGTRLSFSVYAEAIHPEDRQRVADTFRQSVTALNEFQVDYRVLDRLGEVHWVTGSGAPRFSRDGQFQGYVGALLDVSERYEALERLANSEATHRLLTENSSDLISQHAAENGTFLYASPSFKRILGFEPAELVGLKSAFDYVHPEDRPFVEQELLRQRHTGADSEVIEFRMRNSEGVYLWMATNVSVLTNPVTKEKTGSVAITRDITAERRSREALQEREERFRSLTNLSSDWYWETDEHGRFCFRSQREPTPTGLSAEQLLGKTRLDLAFDCNDPGLQRYVEAIAEHQPFKDLRYRTRGPTPASVKHASISGEPIFEGSRFKGYRGVGRDVTDEVEKSARLAQLADENRALVENSLDLIALLDPQGRFLRLNAAVFDILGYEADELLGKPYSDLVHPEELQYIQSIDAGLRTGQNTTRDLENRWIRKDGRVIYMSV